MDAILESSSSQEYTVLGVTRDPTSKSAQKLASKSPLIKVIKGDFADIPQLFKTASAAASQPVWGVFSVQVPMGGGQSPETEEKFGKALIDESLKNGVKHFVQTSVDRGGDEKSWTTPTPIPHFISKHNIELHLRDNAGDKMGWTVLRPTAFMDNFTPGFQFKVFMAAWKNTLGDKPMQLIAARDIGYVGAQAFLEPEKHNHKAIGLAGDDVNFQQLNATFKESRGYDIVPAYSFLGSALTRFVPEVGLMMNWFATDG